MYRQSIQNMEVAILSLDGVILDLNRMRYNYYNRLCKQHNLQLDKRTFHQQLSNMYEMYNDLPLHSIYESGILNAKIERELLQYLTLSGVKVKEGIYELIEYFHQKNIKVAIVSTHHTKNAIEYLKMAKLYNKIHFIVGSDSRCLPLPSNQMLEVIRNHFQCETHHTLVISSFASLNKAANASKMNIIYCNDFIEANSEDKQLCYKCVDNAFEVLNTLLFDKYAEETMYSSILGMNHSMSQYELDETYNTLNQKYADDKELLDIVEQTYQYHSSQVNEHNIKDASIIKTSFKKFTFDDEIEETYQDKKEEIIEKQHINTKETKEEISEVSNQHKSQISHIRQLNKDEEDELSALLNQIQKKDKPADIKKDDFISDFNIDLSQENDETVETIPGKENNNLFIVILLELISSLLSSLCVLFAGIVTSVLLMHQWGKDGFIKVLETIYSIYSTIVTSCFTYLFNTLHHFFNFVPTYDHYLNENMFFSNQGVEFLNMFIFNAVIIFIVRLIIVLIRRKNND